MAGNGRWAKDADLVAIFAKAIGRMRVKDVAAVLGVANGTAGRILDASRGRDPGDVGDLLAYARGQEMCKRLHGSAGHDVGIPIEDLQSLCEPPPVAAVHAVVARAIREKAALVVDYTSRSASRTVVISPARLVFVLDRWHVRAFDHEASKWKDYVLGRMGAPRLEAGYKCPPDAEWSRKVTLAFRVNPALEDETRQMVEAEWSLSGEDSAYEILARSACARYVVRTFCLPRSDGLSRWVPEAGVTAKLWSEVFEREAVPWVS